jgi:F0F1-type ATP synthase assembly protein I
MVVTRPAETKSGHGQKKAVAKSDYPDSFESRQLFISSAISMSWQMALAVLIPIVGGYYLDQALKTTPWITLIGVVLAFVLVALIVRRTISELPEYAKTTKKVDK